MSQKEKLLEKLKSKPKNFTFQETATLLGQFGYYIKPSGKTSDSRIIFVSQENDYIRIHKPHPRNVLKPYQIMNLLNDLKERGLI
jgi:hypothetical protein